MRAAKGALRSDAGASRDRPFDGPRGDTRGLDRAGGRTELPLPTPALTGRDLEKTLAETPAHARTVAMKGSGSTTTVSREWLGLGAPQACKLESQYMLSGHVPRESTE